jgi:hypothetical protein
MLIIEIINKYNIMNINQIIGILFSIFYFGSIIFILTFYSFTVYLIFDDKIIVKYPFMKKREYDISNIIGFNFDDYDGYGYFKIYFINNSINITAHSKKAREVIKRFMDKHYEIIKNRNISKILNEYIEIKYNKSMKIYFYKDKIEIFKKSILYKIYYYENDFIKCYSKYSFGKCIVLYTKDNIKYVLKNNECNGGIGLFDFLLENIKYEETSHNKR